MSDELWSERFNRIDCEIQQIHERWDNRMVFPLSKLSERYLCGELSFHLHLGWPNDTHIPRFYFPRQNATDRRNLRISCNTELPCTSHNDELSVFIDSVHIMNQPEWIPNRVPTAIRLQSLDSCQSRGTGDALYFSAVTGHFVFCNTAVVRFLQEDRELDLSRGLCLEFRGGQFPRNMIEGTPEMMDYLACQHLKPWRDDRIQDEISQPLIGLSIFVSHDWFVCLPINRKSGNWRRSEEPRDFAIQVLDTLVGPL